MVDTLKLALLFVLGLQTAFTPCYLPVVPVFLAVISRQKAKRWLASLLFATGVVLSFVVYGILIGLGGGVVRYIFALLPQQLISTALGLILISIGVALLTPLREVFSYIPSATPSRKVSGYLGSFMFGFMFSLAAAPCAAAVMIAALSQALLGSFTDSLQPVLYMVVYGAGTGLPFLAIGALGGALRFRGGAGFLVRRAEEATGLLLVVTGSASILTIEHFEVVVFEVAKEMYPAVLSFLGLAGVYYSYVSFRAGAYLESPHPILIGAGLTLLSASLLASWTVPSAGNIATLVGLVGRALVLLGALSITLKGVLAGLIPVPPYLQAALDALLAVAFLASPRGDRNMRLASLFFLSLFLLDLPVNLPWDLSPFFVVFSVLSGLSIILSGLRTARVLSVLSLYERL
ncbi:cytochrome c biogenesis CcdA family protein [Thermofilum pendens]|uniref:Cytochrome c biogenesis protein, transmembrane region n=1 Tax=Thermofilum pendens (strain DSM 2475 / Hrk 5) TaxID=368408 RepID=A1RWG3_THEPD|nr:cytochrome c biogenesis protein CcdA [Thermofilum pendens]ABL77543.1 cytochrome c biogenesis protein, transmembrane region [Thermofilum pendens Hrk 5]